MHDSERDDPAHVLPEDGGGHEHIPLTPSEREEAPKPVIKKPSLLSGDDDEPDLCPKCHAPMASADAVVCLECGFDQSKNREVKTQRGVVVTDEKVAAEAVCRPDGLGWKLPLAVGGAAMIVAATLAGVHAGEGAWLKAVLRAAMYAPLQAGLGVLAVVALAKLLQAPVGRLEFAVGRMALAVGAFYLSFTLAQGMEIHPTARFAIGAGIGGALYFVLIWSTFRLARNAAALLVGLHFVTWLVFRLLIVAVPWLER